MNESLELPRQIRKFNPGTLQSDEEVIRQFVVRKPKLGIVLEVLRGNIDSPSCQHVLLVAPRGRGKSMLLARIAAELRSNRGLSERLLPVRFMEESQEIFDMTDFWLESLFYLARESKMCDSELAQELQDVHADLTAEWRGQDLEERARATVLEAADRLGRKLVLMVENLQALCGNVDDDFGWKLRGALQSEPQIILLATATSRFKGLDDAREPFFELFRIVRLEPLDTEECRRLWQVVSGDVVARREIRPLEILTGGNPRLLVIVADFARHRSLRQLMERACEADRRPYGVFPGSSGGFRKDRAPRLSRGDRPLATVEHRRDRGAGTHGRPSRIDPAREACRTGCSNRGTTRQETAIRCRGTSLQHLLQAAARTRRGGRRPQPDSLHGGVLQRSRIDRDVRQPAIGVGSVISHSKGI